MKSRRSAVAVVSVGLAVALAGCSSGQSAESQTTAEETVTIATNDGQVEVPANPERVAVLDNTAFETVRAFGIEPVAVPKPLLPNEGFEDWAENEEIADAGSHREPDLEAVSAAEPDLIIGGQRFADYTDDLSAIAPVVDIAPSDEAEEGYVEGLKTQTETLGEIFGEEDRAAEVVADLEAAVEEASTATNGESVFLAVVSGGRVDNGAGRIGRLLEPLDLTDVFASEDLDSESVHNNSGLAPETVAQANPDWMIVLDRDAATTDDGSNTPAQQVVAAQEAWAGTTFMTQDQVVYLAPDFYLREGIQAYTEAFQQIADAFTS